MGKAVSGIVGSVANIFTGADSTRAAGEQASAAQAQAARDAAQAAAFRPVGMTTRFGSSQFTREIDPKTGMPYISAAEYTAAPELAALQNQLFGGFGGGYGYAQQQGQQLGALTPAAQQLFGLGGQILPSQYSTTPSAEAQLLSSQFQQAQQGLMPSSFQTTASPEAQAYAQQLQQTGAGYLAQSPEEARAEYMRTQQAVLAPGRAAEEARLATANYGRGTGGLGVQTGTGTAPSNPLAQALFNARSQQDLQLAAQAEQAAQQRQAFGLGMLGQGYQTTTSAQELARQNMLQNLGLSLGFGQQAYQTTASAEDLARQRSAADIGLGAGLFGTGASLLGTQAAGMAGAYSPLQTQLGLAGQVEQMSQMPYQLGIQLGQAQQPGQTAGSQMYQQGLTQAAQTQFGATQAANAANAQFWGGLVSAAGTAGGAYFAPKGVGTMPR
jgi:ribosomal protein L11 methylase PrmA